MDKIDMNMVVPAGLGLSMITYAFYANHEMNQLKEVDKETILKIEDLKKEVDNKIKEMNAILIKYKKKVDDLESDRYNLENKNRELLMQVDYVTSLCENMKDALSISGIEYEPVSRMKQNKFEEKPRREVNNKRYSQEPRENIETNKYTRNSAPFEKSRTKRWSSEENENGREIKMKSHIYSPTLPPRKTQKHEEIEEYEDDDAVEDLFTRVKSAKN